jgi:hypothetical protein
VSRGTATQSPHGPRFIDICVWVNEVVAFEASTPDRSHQVELEPFAIIAASSSERAISNSEGCTGALRIEATVRAPHAIRRCSLLDGRQALWTSGPASASPSAKLRDQNPGERGGTQILPGRGRP